MCLPAAIIQINEHRFSKHKLTIVHPEKWIPYIPLCKEDNEWIATDYDELLDSPILAGEFKSFKFSVCNYKHKLIVIGQTPKDVPKNLVQDLTKVCESICQLMNTHPPCENRYIFGLQFNDKAFGGLEHSYSSIIQFPWKTYLI